MRERLIPGRVSRGLTCGSDLSTLKGSPVIGGTAATGQSGARRFEQNLDRSGCIPDGAVYHRAEQLLAMRRKGRGQGQTDVPAEQPPAGQGPRFPLADADPCGPGNCDRAAPQGPRHADCLNSRRRGMLPARNRMTRSAEFDLAVRHGVRAPQPSIVVHARRPVGELSVGSPQIGLIVAKSVGGSVDRHRVARLIRHAARGILTELDPADRIVIRALPASRTTPFTALEQQLLTGVRRAQHLLNRSR